MIPKHAPFTSVVLDRISSPGNLGTIIRTCDAFGANGAILSGHTVDPYDPLSIRASVGTIFSLPIASVGSNEELSGWLDDLRKRFPGLQVVGTSAKAVVSVYDTDMSAPIVIILGNETYGISDFLDSITDAAVRIPINGQVRSLNVASAAAIFLYEIRRQRKAVETTTDQQF